MSQNTTPAESLLPYAQWTEEALRGVARSALVHVGQHGLPGEHHFYLSFRTDHPGVSVPGHLKARFPREMTIVLQHRFWDLAVDPARDSFSVGLSFGGVPSKLTVPFPALTAFADPHAGFGLRFQDQSGGDQLGGDQPGEHQPGGDAMAGADPAGQPQAAAAMAGQPAPAAATAPEAAEAVPQVVSLDAFRRRPVREG